MYKSVRVRLSGRECEFGCEGEGEGEGVRVRLVGG